MKVKPMDDRVLIEPMEQESKTASGIIIPDSAKEKPVIGTVVAVEPMKIYKTKLKSAIKFFMQNTAAKKSLSKEKIIR